MQVTTGLRTSRTRQVWLHSTQGRMRAVDPSASFAPSLASAIIARVISTRSAWPSATSSPACPTSTSEPWAMRATPSGSAVRTSAAVAELKPGSTWPSGRVAQVPYPEPRTTVR